MSKGMRVALPNAQASDDKKLAFSTDGDYIKLDVGHNPPFFDFRKVTFNNNPPKPALNDTAIYEMVKIEHNLGYIPASLVYFYSYDFTGAYIVPDSYQMGKLFLTGAGFVSQYFSYTVTDKYLKIYYAVYNGDDPTPIPFDVTGYSFGFKYFIFANNLQETIQ